MRAPVLLICPIRPTSWKGNSANFAITEFSEIERGPEREIGKEDGEVLPGRAVGKGGGSSVRAPLGSVQSATVEAFSRI